MDGRIALAPGTILKLNTRTGYTPYTINREIGRGGSCLVYDASYTDNLNNFKLVRIKECYPHALRIIRDADGNLTAESRDSQAFAAAKERLIKAYQKNYELFTVNGLTNTVTNTSDIHESNGTIYIVSVYVNGKTLTDFQGDSLHECVSLILSTGKVLQRIHEAGYLYLDLKPDNILTIDGSLDLVQLFDFDSMVSMQELKDAIQANDASGLRTSYTKGFASLEHQTGKLRQIGKHSDLYSLGAGLFYMLWHKTPSAFYCDISSVYDYENMAYKPDNYQDSLFPALTVFFHKTLASYHADRYQDATEAIDQLKEILRLSDETKPWLRSTPIQPSPVFYGRDAEMAELSLLIHQNEHQITSLYGMGGIGKSALVRQYLSYNRSDWDAVLWLYCQGNFAESIADDTLVQINTVTRMKEESIEEYLKRKLKVLSELSRTQRILMVLDNFSADHLDQLQHVAQIGMTTLLISRERMPEGLFPSAAVKEMEYDDLIQLFEHHSKCDMSNEENLMCFHAIVSAIERHTLLTELIARQIAKSYLDMQEAKAMMVEIGLSDLSKEKIDYVRDQITYHGTLLKILDRLVEFDQFTEQDRLCMKLLSMFDAPGVEANLFRLLAELKTLDFVNDLESAGWLKTDGSMLYLHPMMQEYIRTWPWETQVNQSVDQMMKKLYEMIRPAGTRHDGSKQFPADYSTLYQLLRTAEQLIYHSDRITEYSQRLHFRLLMDAPVDQDASALFRIVELLNNPKYLDDDSILRLYENAAYLQARLFEPEEAIRILGEMKRYLLKHPSAYYLSAYHRAAAVILHNADEYRYFKQCLKNQDKAIAAVKLSMHPDAMKQLAACLLDKATTLLSADIDRKQARRLVMEATPIVEQYTTVTDYERYQYNCIAAMCYAMDGDPESAESHLKTADAICFGAPDSDLAVAEHLIEQVAPIRIAMEKYDEAADAVLQAIDLCDHHETAIRYRETRYDAYLFLGRIYEMNSEFMRGEAAFAEAEKRAADSPFERKLPHCPEKIRIQAYEEREHQK